MGNCKAKTTDSAVNIRSGPGTSYASVTRVARGEYIEVDNSHEYNSNWNKVAYKNKYLGYMHKDYFEIDNENDDNYYMINMLQRYGTTTWERGHEDETECYIANIQADLIDWGEHHRNEVTVCNGADGIFGGNTEQAVRDFQRYYDLGVDGKVGPTTKAWLYQQVVRPLGWAI